MTSANCSKDLVSVKTDVNPEKVEAKHVEPKKKVGSGTKILSKIRKFASFSTGSKQKVEKKGESISAPHSPIKDKEPSKGAKPKKEKEHEQESISKAHEEKKSVFGAVRGFLLPSSISTDLKKMLAEEKKTVGELRYQLDQSMQTTDDVRKEKMEIDENLRTVIDLLKIKLGDANRKLGEEEAAHEQEKKSLENLMASLREESTATITHFESALKDQEKTVNGLQDVVDALKQENYKLEKALSLEKLRSGNLQLVFKINANIEELARKCNDGVGIGVLSEPIRVGDVTLRLNAYKCKEKHIELRILKTGNSELKASTLFTFDADVKHQSKPKTFKSGDDWKGSTWGWTDLLESRNGMPKLGERVELSAEMTVHEFIASSTGEVIQVQPLIDI